MRRGFAERRDSTSDFKEFGCFSSSPLKRRNFHRRSGKPWKFEMSDEEPRCKEPDSENSERGASAPVGNMSPCSVVGLCFHGDLWNINLE